MSALEEPPGDRIEQIAAFIYGEVGPTSICAWESVDEPSKVQWRAIARHLRTLALAAPVGKAGRSAEAAGDEVLRQERAAAREEPRGVACDHCGKLALEPLHGEDGFTLCPKCACELAAAWEELPEGFRDEDIEALRRTQERYRTSREEGDYATREEPPPSDDADFAAWCSEIPKET